MRTEARVYRSRYRALRRCDLEAALQAAGCGEFTWIEPKTSGFHQPLLAARGGNVRS